MEGLSVELEQQLQKLNDILENINPVKMKYIKHGYLELLISLKQNIDTIFLDNDNIDLIFKFLKMTLDNNAEDIKVVMDFIISVNNMELTVNLFNTILEIAININDCKEMIEEIEKGIVKNKENDDDNVSLTMRRQYAMLGVHCGISERELDECSYLYFKDCLTELTYKVKWDITLGTLGQSQMSEEGAKAISESINDNNPFNIENTINKENKSTNGNSINTLDAIQNDFGAIQVDTVSQEELDKILHR